MAEGARLESVYTLTGIQGSNPCLSASISPFTNSADECEPNGLLHRENRFRTAESAAGDSLSGGVHVEPK